MQNLPNFPNLLGMSWQYRSTRGPSGTSCPSNPVASAGQSIQPGSASFIGVRLILFQLGNLTRNKGGQLPGMSSIIIYWPLNYSP
jgi:hypothetical protein